MDDPFFIPGIFASPPKLSDAELRAEPNDRLPERRSALLVLCAPPSRLQSKGS